MEQCAAKAVEPFLCVPTETLKLRNLFATTDLMLLKELSGPMETKMKTKAQTLGLKKETCNVESISKLGDFVNTVVINVA